MASRFGEAGETLDVSRETLERLEAYEKLLGQWQRVKNLVAPSTLSQIWQRHFADSLQLLALAPAALRWVDIGSGAGFPGLVIAASLAAKSGVIVHLIESDSRKCAFLREAARQLGAPAIIHNARAETIIGDLGPVDVVTARAVAPLQTLVTLALPLLQGGAVGLFPKGRGYASELTEFVLPQKFQLDFAPSLTENEAAIVIVRGTSATTLAPDP
ncbi:MAG: 16S rRNA (guanine(527)-N(7))-methyltransferase RsmG [Beijerinckiaceae bacterium]|nr:16S rRNA (guanine(527)-N(7))-methyltransferase RsmG [Beijerinckiaceae bacterium]